MIYKINYETDKVVNIIDNIFDYEIMICNSRQQKERETIGFMPNCMLYKTAVNILTELGYTNNIGIWEINNEHLSSKVKIVPKKLDSLCIAKDSNNDCIIAGKVWDRYDAVPYLFKVLEYNRHYKPWYITNTEVERLKVNVCRYHKMYNCYINPNNYCPIFDLDEDTCGWIPRDFKSEEQELEYLDNMIHNLYVFGILTGIINEKGEIVRKL